MKKKNITVSMPAETVSLLKSMVGPRNISAFVAKVVDKALESKVGALRKAYQEAEDDPDVKGLLEDWEKIDAEGWE